MGTVYRPQSQSKLTGHYSWNDATPFLPLVLYLNYLFYLHILKFYPIRLSFIYFVYSNLNPGEHPKAPMTTTHKSPNMAPSKFHVSLWRPSILQKRLWLIWVISLHQSVCQVPKNSKRMHQEWPCVVGVAQGRGLRPYVGGAECLVCQLHCARLGKGFWGLCGYIESVCSEGICRSWKNEFHSEIAELKPWRHFSWIDLYVRVYVILYVKLACQISLVALRFY